MMMKKILLLFCTACLASCSNDRGRMDISYFLDEMLSPASLASGADPEFITGQVSSRDRSSIAKEEAGWFANNDGFGVERVDTLDGRIEKVLFNQPGPGVISRIWITTRSPKGTLRFYFDGNEEPGWVIPSFDLMEFGIKDLGALANPHTSYEKGVSGGSTLFLPIPYGKSCKITLEEPLGWEGVPRYYHINFRSYPEGTPIETFSLKEVRKCHADIVRAGVEMQSMPGSHGRQFRQHGTIRHGQSLSLEVPPVSGKGSSINHISIKVDVDDSLNVGDVMDRLTVRMAFDGEPCVEVPLSSFAGAGIGAPEVESRYLWCDGNGNVDVAFVCPYRSSAQISVSNDGASDADVSVSANTSPFRFTDSTLYFKACFKAGIGLPVDNVPENNYDWNFVDISGGKGKYVADVLTLFNHTRAWYGEGDEKIYVDGEDFPSHFGTGTEDYYNSSWAPVITFNTAFGGAPRADLASSAGYNTFFRLRGLDVIPFSKSLKFDLEMISWMRGTVDYFSTVFFYGSSSCNSNSRSSLPLAYEFPKNPTDPDKYKVRGCIEFEKMRPESKSDLLHVDVQPMSAFPDGEWSEGKQIIATGGKVGDWVQYNIPNLENGKYDLTVHYTMAGDYADLLIEACGTSARVDSWSPLVTNGSVKLKDVNVNGSLPLKISIVGKNSRSVGYFFGLDCVTVERSGELVSGARYLEFPDAKRYVNVPVSKNTSGHVMTISADGGIIGQFNLDIDPDSPHMVAFVDVQRYSGKKIRVAVENYDGPMDVITNTDEPVDADQIYSEELRPLFHFTARRGWFNDPNGLIFYEGKYHMYYQYNPLGVFWGNMSWGHAESTDMVNWEEKSPVLYPLPSTGDCFTGSSFVDHDNKLRLNKDGKEAIVAFYLRTGSGLSYAYSLDGGETYDDYFRNPLVAKAVGRERIDSPKPIFHPESEKWVAPVFDDRFEPSLGRNIMTVSLYSSYNLRVWKKESDVGEIGLDSECPDLFPLFLDGNPDKVYWILVQGNAAYCVGHFDGKYFIALSTGLPATHEDFVPGIPFGHYYASTTFSNIPQTDGRRIQIAWMKNVFNDSTIFHDMPFNSQMSLPIELTLHSTPDGPRLFMNPVKEVERMRSRPVVKVRRRSLGTDNLLGKFNFPQSDICLDAQVLEDAHINLKAKGLCIDWSDGELVVDGQHVKLEPVDGKISLRIISDTRSVEIVGNNGEVYIPLLYPFICSTYSLTGDNCFIDCLKAYKINSIWEK